MSHYKIFNFFGIPLNFGALGANIGVIVSHLEINTILTLTISALAIIWWIMKIYDQYIITRKRRAEDKNK